MSEIKCSKCGSQTIPETINSTSGTDREISLTLENLPCVKCIKCGQRYVPDNDFGPELFTAIIEDSDMVFANEKGLFKKKLECRKCHADLTDKPTDDSEWNFTVNLKGYQPINTRFKAPNVRCPQCDTRQIAPPRKFDDMSLAALDDLLSKAGIEYQ